MPGSLSESPPQHLKSSSCTSTHTSARIPLQIPGHRESNTKGRRSTA
jgi:hypothetical protein